MKTDREAQDNTHHWHDNAGAIFLMVILCQGVMEAGVYVLSMHVSVLNAHVIMAPVVALLGTLMGSELLTFHQTLRKRLLAEIEARDLAQKQQAESARQLKHMLEDTEAHNQRLLSFGEFTHALLACRSEDDICDSIPKYGLILFPNTIGAVYQPEAAGQWRAVCRWPENNGLITRVRVEKTPDLPEARAQEVIRGVRTGVAARRSLTLSVTSDNVLHAVIYVELPGAGSEDPRQSRMAYMAKAFCEEISLAFANLRLRTELGQQAIRDPLTGLFNRRYMEEALSRELKRAERHRTPLSVLMIDLDHFKLLNDQFGHACGDAVLNGLGGTILWHSREDDIACRYGGEEFLVVLPNTGADGALAKANQLRSHIKKLATLTKYRRQITASIGIASYPQDGLNVESLVKSADAAMYTAKRLGRNRACRANELALTSA